MYILMQCIALYQSGNWKALAERDLAEKTADGNNVLHIICSRGDLQGLKNLAERARENVENALAQINNNGETPVDLAKKKQDLIDYIQRELDVDTEDADAGITNLLERLGKVVREESNRLGLNSTVDRSMSSFQPYQDNEFVRKLAESLTNPSVSHQGGSKKESQEGYDMWKNPRLNDQQTLRQKGSASRQPVEEESEWDDSLFEDTPTMAGGKGCGSLPYELTETSRHNVHRQLASELISMSGGYVDEGDVPLYDDDDSPNVLSDAMFGGAKKSRKDERDEDPDFNPDSEDYEEEMLGGLTDDEREYSDLLKKTLASNEFERLTKMPSSLDAVLSRPRNEQADVAYKSFIPKLMEYLGLDEETARFYRTAIKVHLLQTNPELRKNEDLKIKEMEKMFASARALKAAVKKIDFDEIKKFMEMRREEGEKRRAANQEAKKKLRTDRVGKKPAAKAKAQPSRVRSQYVASEGAYSDDDDEE